MLRELRRDTIADFAALLSKYAAGHQFLLHFSHVVAWLWSLCVSCNVTFISQGLESIAPSQEHFECERLRFVKQGDQQ